jgi:hypothetical protein
MTDIRGQGVSGILLALGQVWGSIPQQNFFGDVSGLRIAIALLSELFVLPWFTL